MVFCNALTEWYNAKNSTSYSCAYYTDEDYTTPVWTSTDSDSFDTDPGSENNPYIKASASGNTDMANCTATGFRLLTSDEWELASRFIEDSNGDGDIKDADEYYHGDYASGAWTYYNDINDSNSNSVFDGKETNDLVAVYNSYWDGSTWIATGVSVTAEAKSKGIAGVNALGLYDMSGNVWEWCFDLWNSSYRLLRGGSCLYSAFYLQVSFWRSLFPYTIENSRGFRLGRIY